MRFSQDFIDKVRDANNIAEIIGQYTELKGNGHRFMGRCPFPDHNDKSPSFSVTQDNQLYYCYGCKKGGNVYTFLQTYNGLSFPEAVETLARRAALPIPESETPKSGPRGMTSDQKGQLMKVNRLAAVHFHQLLKSLALDHAAREYLVKRGLSDEIVDVFRLGYSPAERADLSHHLRARGVPMELAESLQLVRVTSSMKNASAAALAQNPDAHYDFFRDRLMFPIFSPTADVIGFGGRALKDDVQPKYYNSSESAIFHKGRILYGLHETGKFIRAQDHAIVVEGYMDAIALYAAGIKNVVAILGTAFTTDHAKLLKRYTLNVTMLLDGDEAGFGAAEKSLPVLLGAGLRAKGFLLPDQMDPDDFVKAKGPEALKEELARTPELFNLLLTRRWLEGFRGSSSEKVAVIEQAAPALRGMQDRALMELYFLEISRQLDVDMDWVRKAASTAMASATAEANRAKKFNPAETAESSAPAEAPIPAETEVPEMIQLQDVPKDEAFVLSLLLHSETLMRELCEAGTDAVLDLISHPGVKQVLLEAELRFRADSASFAALAAHFSSRVDNPALLSYALELTKPEAGTSAPEGLERRWMTDYLAALQRKRLRSQGKAMVKQLRDSHLSPEKLPEKLKEFMSLQKSRLALDRTPNSGSHVQSAEEPPEGSQGGSQKSQ